MPRTKKAPPPVEPQADALDQMRAYIDAQELDHLAPIGSTPFLSLVSAYIRKAKGPAGTSGVARRFGHRQQFAPGPNFDAKLRQIAGWMESNNAAEGFAQLVNALASDEREAEKVGHEQAR